MSCAVAPRGSIRARARIEGSPKRIRLVYRAQRIVMRLFCIFGDYLFAPFSSEVFAAEGGISHYLVSLFLILISAVLFSFFPILFTPHIRGLLTSEIFFCEDPSAL